MIVCPLCQQVMREAVFISCCGYTYCLECLTDYIFNTDVKGCGRCPNCNSPVESSESFTENPTVRELVRKFNAGVTNLFNNTAKSAFQVKSESGTEAVAPASTSVAASTSAAVKVVPSAKPEKDAPTTTTTTSSVGSTSATSLPGSQSPLIEVRGVPFSCLLLRWKALDLYAANLSLYIIKTAEESEFSQGLPWAVYWFLTTSINVFNFVYLNLVSIWAS